ncbi:alpha,alpha-trehalose-phosphate synthase (UDP-forming) [Beijerinckia indica]|uniref:Alpha,alpha-trehalose-phosphate synthase (UDP-forming) n=1 Tax=Beijerinckia indica subsp. indica (strain ATCC 9039 / DSM 1715 / NCIMB 8712) TaxID=395963 RepID=B2IBE9_BEII9|nr:trehalose-6-phosphate synthase [Beijerinckia indica]ACB96575.1 Alpha,alpha-trehalose-phosphate synthase (UDP-forming) [Beijerinckia indica subsp. indica ATCC 9039]
MVALELLREQTALSKIKPAARLVVVSNRVPTTGSPNAGGLAVALEEALQTRGGLWFGWSGKISQDIEAPPHPRVSGSITYAVCDLSRRDMEEYYHGFANRVLWPICHYRTDLAEISTRDATGYFRVNEYFARGLVDLLQPNDIVWVHDYHFLPLASFLRQLGAGNRIGFFHHIPWPAIDIAMTMPSYERLLRAMTAYDLLGFQTPYDAANFRHGLDQTGIGQILDKHRCKANGRIFKIGAFPISIDTQAFAEEARNAEKNPVVRRARAAYDGRPLAIGVDRLDYTKGLPQRIEAFGTFLERSPQAAKARTTLLQVTPKSRSEVPEYAQLQCAVAEQVGRVNGKLGEVDWSPVAYLNKTMSRPVLAGLYRMARVGLVTPLRDGMNLVAKEYVAAQSPDDPGVLVLSQFAGAAVEMDGALLVNPHDTDGMAATIARAFSMPIAERKYRYAAMMERLDAHDVANWSDHFLATLGEPDDMDALGGEILQETALPPPLDDPLPTWPGRWPSLGH